MADRVREALGIVPARGGSKGIHRKNLRLLEGRPLIAYAIQAGLESRLVDRVVVSTEDPEIADMARSLGADVPFFRPAELAADETPTLPVLQHAIRHLREREGYEREVAVLLQPTAPLTTARHVDEALELLAETGADAVVSVAEIPRHYHPAWAFRLSQGCLVPYLQGESLPTRRQALEPLYSRNGSIYATRTAVVLAGSLYGADTRAYLMDPLESANVDSEVDLLWAGVLMEWRRERMKEAQKGAQTD